MIAHDICIFLWDKKKIDSSIFIISEEGNEFKIYTIEPASAPATGYHPGNPNKDRVLIVLTDGTAFPKRWFHIEDI